LGSLNNTPDETNAVHNAVSCYKEEVQFSASFVRHSLPVFDEIFGMALNFVFSKYFTSYNCEYTTWQISCVSFIRSYLNVQKLHWHPPNPARNLAGDGRGRISKKKWPDSGFAGAEIRYNPSILLVWSVIHHCTYLALFTVNQSLALRALTVKILWVTELQTFVAEHFPVLTFTVYEH